MSDDVTSDAPSEQPVDAPEAPDAGDASGQHEEKHGFKEGFRGAVGKVVGIAVETGSMLSGNAGEMVSAEGAVAEKDTEDLLDRIDGEG